MRWNWQLPDWPNFQWNSHVLEQAEHHFVREAGVIAGIRLHFSPDAAQEIIIDMMREEALATFAIEGETLDRSSVQGSIRRALGLEPDRRAPAREQAVADVAVDVYRHFSQVLDEARLFHWHRQFMTGRRDLESVGAYRSFSDAMQIMSGDQLRPDIHFEAPPSAVVPQAMKHFIEWFNNAAPGTRAAIPALTKAGLAHLYFESIHPFEDGNGRVGRAISDIALAQHLGSPMISLLSTTLLQHRKEYYAALAAANTSNEVTRWLLWFATMVLNSQRQVRAQLEFVMKKTAFIDRYAPSLNERQLRAIMRMLREGPRRFAGGLSAEKYLRITGASTATATRDLASLVKLGALTQTGVLRYRRYELSLKAMLPNTIYIDENGALNEREPSLGS